MKIILWCTISGMETTLLVMVLDVVIMADGDMDMAHMVGLVEAVAAGVVDAAGAVVLAVIGKIVIKTIFYNYIFL